MFLCIVSELTIAQNACWQQRVNYNIEVSLNDSDHTLDGVVKMEYYNNSPDTLTFIWIHLWPNAYKNDRTAFSDQLLKNGRTDFYFSSAEQRGYINRLEFKVDGMAAETLDHPEHQDIIKLVLPSPLFPGSVIKIQTPFHVKLPFNFSRGGHVEQAYQVTQWYPKPAVYDRKGWHPMPYLDQGEFYSEFGNYKVQITLPQNYVVAATGDLADTDEVNWLSEKAKAPRTEAAPIKSKSARLNGQQKKKDAIFPPSSSETKTLHYSQDSVHDFAWFADKRFAVLQDTIKVKNRVINAQVFYIDLPGKYETWKTSLEAIRQTIGTRGAWLGEYPYASVKVCEAEMGFSGGMEYPTITSISPMDNAEMLNGTIEHEVGHNWNYGILASNERQHPWMDEGINSFYDARFKNIGKGKDAEDKTPGNFFSKRLPEDLSELGLRMLTHLKKDQPIETPAEVFNELNYGLIAYGKTALWMQQLENRLGRTSFDSAMQAYYAQWKFKHPYPEDFRQVLETVSGQDLSNEFSMLKRKGPLQPAQNRRRVKPYPFFNFKESGKYRYIFAAPAVGYNFYDKFMIGGLLHNYTLPAEKLQFVLAPLYGTGSKQLNGLGRISYTLLPGDDGRQLEFALAGASFSGDSYTDSTNRTTQLRFTKLAPSIKYTFANHEPQSKLLHFIQFKSFLISEQRLRFSRDTVTDKDIISYPFEHRYINQLRFVLDNNRVLYPYSTEIKLEQGRHFARLAFTGNYYFNYVKAGGVNLRLFAGKFFYTRDKTFTRQFETSRYHLNMTGPKGDEDYTYNNYFIGRNEFEGFASQQIMQRDGFFKVRTDLLNNKIGKSDDWLAALNFTTDIPASIDPLKVMPVKIPWKIFVDLGTYAEAWSKNATSGKLIYDAGIQVSLFSNFVNIYIPVLYSKVYRDYFKSTITEKRFLRNISFNIDVHRLSFRKLFPKIPF